MPVKSKISPPFYLVDGDLTGKKWIPQFGIRGSRTIEGFDISSYVLRHIDRRAPLVGTHEYRFSEENVFPESFKNFVFAPTPYFVMAWELGLTVEAMLGDAIFKFEGASLRYDKHPFILTGNGLSRKEDSRIWPWGLKGVLLCLQTKRCLSFWN